MPATVILKDNKRDKGHFLHLHYQMRSLSGLARRRKALTRNIETVRQFDCAQCGGAFSIQVHHIKPVWACALEELLISCPIQYQWDQPIPMLIPNGPIGHIVDPWNRTDNLLPLCSNCHRKRGKEANMKWKEYFRQYHVAFTKPETIKLWNRDLFFRGYP